MSNGWHKAHLGLLGLLVGLTAVAHSAPWPNQSRLLVPYGGVYGGVYGGALATTGFTSKLEVDANWIKMDESFPTTERDAHGLESSRFFYVRGSHFSTHNLTQRLADQLNLDGDRVRSIQLALKLWYNQVDFCTRSFYIIDKSKEVPINSFLHWNPIDHSFDIESVEQLHSFVNDFKMQLDVRNCDNSFLAVKALKLRYDHVMQGEDDKPIQRPPTLFDEIKGKELPDHFAYDCNSQAADCEMIIKSFKIINKTKPLLMFHAKSSVTVSLFVDDKMITSAIWDPNKEWSSFPLNDNQIAEVDGKDVLVKIKAVDDKNIWFVFPGNADKVSGKNLFKLSREAKAAISTIMSINGGKVMVWHMRQNDETTTVPLSETALPNKCYVLSVWSDADLSKLNTEYIVWASVKATESENRYKLVQRKATDTTEFFKFCTPDLIDLSHATTVKNSQLWLELKDHSNANLYITGLTIDLASDNYNPPDPLYFFPKTLPKGNNTKVVTWAEKVRLPFKEMLQTNQGKEDLVDQVNIDKNKITVTLTQGPEEKYQLYSGWLKGEGNVHLTDTDLQLKLESTLANAASLRVDAYLCDTSASCLPAKSITRTSTVSNAVINFAIRFNPHPNRAAAKFRLEFTLTVPEVIDTGVNSVSLTLLSFGDPCVLCANQVNAANRQCEADPALHHANVLKLDQNSHVCKCKPGKTGDTCQLDDYCHPSDLTKEPCSNFPACSNHKDYAECHCKLVKDKISIFDLTKNDCVDHPIKPPNPSSGSKQLEWTIDLEKINTQIYDLNFKLAHGITDDKTQVEATVELKLVRSGEPQISLMLESVLLHKDSSLDEFRLSQFANLDMVNQLGNQLIVTVISKEDLTKHALNLQVSNPERAEKIIKGFVHINNNELFPKGPLYPRDMDVKLYTDWFENQISTIDDAVFAQQASFSATMTVPITFTIELCRPRSFDGKGIYCVPVDSSTVDKLRMALRQFETFNQVQLVFSFKSTTNPNPFNLNLSLFNSCHDNPCGSNGICKPESAAKPTCTCNPGYKGERCEINTLQVCDASKIGICKRYNAKCDDSSLTFRCICPPGYEFSQTDNRCHRQVSQSVEHVCGYNTATGQTSCFLNDLLTQMNYLPRYFPTITKQDKSTDLYFSVQKDSKVTITVDDPDKVLDASKNQDVCLKFKYYVAPGAHVKLLLNAQTEVFRIGAVQPIQSDKSSVDTTVELSAEQELCLRSLVDASTLASLTTLSFVADSQSTDQAVVVQFIPQGGTGSSSLLVVRPVEHHPPAPLPYLTANNAQLDWWLNKTHKAYDVINQWAVLFPKPRLSSLFASSQIIFVARQSDTIEEAYVESHWIHRSKQTPIYLHFKLLSPDGKSSLNSVLSVEALLIAKDRAQLGRILSKTLSDQERASPSILFNELVSTSVDTDTIYKLVLRIRFRDENKGTGHSLFTLTDLSYGDPCFDKDGHARKCYEMDKTNQNMPKISDNVACLRDVGEKGYVNWQCDCVGNQHDTTLGDQGVRGQDCQQRNYCKFAHSILNDKNLRSGELFCKPHAQCREGSYKSSQSNYQFHFLCMCDNRNEYFDLDKDHKCKTLSKCLTDPCHWETQHCDRTGSQDKCDCKTDFVANTTEPLECLPKDPCELSTRLDSSNRQVCVRSQDGKVARWVCPKGFVYSDKDKRCEARLCSFPGMNNCTQLCTDQPNKEPFYTCSCYNEDNYEPVPDKPGQCRLKDAAQQRCKSCQGKNHLCRPDGVCMCAPGFTKDGDECTASLGRDLYCPSGQYKLEMDGKLVCQCPDSPYWQQEANGTCSYIKSICDVAQPGASACSARGAYCELDSDDWTMYRCSCPVGKVYHDRTQSKINSELLSDPVQQQCYDVCDLPYVRSECASRGATCNSAKLWYQVIYFKKANPDPVDFCDCVSGTFFQASTDSNHYCQQQSNTLTLTMSHSWTFELENRWQTIRTKFNIPVNSPSNTRKIENLDPVNYARVVLGVESVKREMVAKMQVNFDSALRREIVAEQTRLLLESLQIVSSPSHTSTNDIDLSMNHQSYISIADIEQDPSDSWKFLVKLVLAQGQDKNIVNLIEGVSVEHKGNQLIPYLSLSLLNGSVVSDMTYNPCQVGNVCHGFSDCVPYNGSADSRYFSCQCNSQFFDIEQRYTFKSDKPSVILRNERCLAKELCSSCTGNRECIEKEPNFDKTSHTWHKEADCRCAEGYRTSKEGDCVAVCTLDPCDHGTCHRVGREGTRCQCQDGFYGDRCQHELSSNTGFVVAVVLLSILAVIAIGGAFFFYSKSWDSSFSSSISPSTSSSPLSKQSSRPTPAARVATINPTAHQRTTYVASGETTTATSGSDCSPTVVTSTTRTTTAHPVLCREANFRQFTAPELLDHQATIPLQPISETVEDAVQVVHSKSQVSQAPCTQTSTRSPSPSLPLPPEPSSSTEMTHSTVGVIQSQLVISQPLHPLPQADHTEALHFAQLNLVESEIPECEPTTTAHIGQIDGESQSQPKSHVPMPSESKPTLTTSALEAEPSHISHCEYVHFEPKLNFEPLPSDTGMELIDNQSVSEPLEVETSHTWPLPPPVPVCLPPPDSPTRVSFHYSASESTGAKVQRTQTPFKSRSKPFFVPIHHDGKDNEEDDNEHENEHESLSTSMSDSSPEANEQSPALSHRSQQGLIEDSQDTDNRSFQSLANLVADVMRTRKSYTLPRRLESILFSNPRAQST